MIERGRPYVLLDVGTPEGTRVVASSTKVRGSGGRILGPLLHADRRPAPVGFRHALGTTEPVLGDGVRQTCLGLAPRNW